MEESVQVRARKKERARKSAQESAASISACHTEDWGLIPCQGARKLEYDYTRVNCEII